MIDTVKRDIVGEKGSGQIYLGIGNGHSTAQEFLVHH